MCVCVCVSVYAALCVHINSREALIESSAIYDSRLDPTQLPAEFIFRARGRVSEIEPWPDGRRFKQANVCSGCFDHKSRVGVGAGV